MLYRTVVLGAGAIAGQHFKTLNKLDSFVPVAVADINISKAQDISRQYGVKPYEDYKQMIEELQPDVAIVTLPHFLHKEASLFCIDKGCHVMLEKPMAINVKECEEINDRVRRKQLQLMVGHTQHYIAANILAKQTIEREQLGELVMVNDFRHVDYFRESRPAWFLQKELSGGGIMMNLGSHSIDKIQWILGCTFESVKARLSYSGDRGDVEGSGCLFLETADHIPVTIAQSGYKSMVKDETEFVFTEGSVRLNTGQGKVTLIRGHEASELDIPRLPTPFEQQYFELKAAIEGTAPLQCTGEYATSIIQILEAVYQSDKTGQTVSINCEAYEPIRGATYSCEKQKLLR